MVSQKLGIPFKSSSAFFDPSSLISVNLLHSISINFLLSQDTPVLILTVSVSKREDRLLISGFMFALQIFTWIWIHVEHSMSFESALFQWKGSVSIGQSQFIAMILTSVMEALCW